MKKGRNPRVKSILVVGSCLLFCLSATGNAAENIQIRKSPTTDGLVVDTIPKRDDFKIIESFGSWRYILIDGSTYGGGWVHAEDLKNERSEHTDSKNEGRATNTDVLKEPSSAKTNKTVHKSSQKPKGSVVLKKSAPSSSHGRATAGTFTISPMSVHKSTKKAQTKADLIAVTETKRELTALPPRKGQNEESEDLMIVQSEKEKAAPPPHLNSAVPESPSSKDFSETSKQIEPTVREERPQEMPAHTDAVKNADIGSENSQNNPLKNHTIFLSTASASINEPSSPLPGVAQEAPPQKMVMGNRQGDMGVFIDLGLRLLSLIVSCIAIVFAYKAKRMADVSYHLVSQLQQKMVTDRRREFDA